MTYSNEFLASPTNPNGMFELVTRQPEQFAEVPYSQRLTMVIGDVYTFAVEVAGLDPDMAEIMAARAVTEVSIAINPDITAEELQDYLEAGLLFGREQMADRAITNILD